MGRLRDQGALARKKINEFKVSILVGDRILDGIVFFRVAARSYRGAGPNKILIAWDFHAPFHEPCLAPSVGLVARMKVEEI